MSDFLPLHARLSVVTVPAGLSTKEELLAALGSLLSFPDWAGANWDALSDLLRDLSWRDEETLLLHHQDVPLSGEARDTYLDVLDEAVASWAEDRPGRFVVSFPPGATPTTPTPA